MAIPPSFDKAGDFKDGFAPVALCSDPQDIECEWGVIDKKGEYILKPQLLGATNFSEGLLPFCPEKCGFIDTTGKTAIRPVYDYVESFSEGLAAVQINKQFGFIDIKGNMVIPPRDFDDVNSFHEGMAVIEKYHCLL